MPSDTQIARWGNSLAIRIPRSIVKEANLSEGDQLSLNVAQDGSVVLKTSRRKYSLEELCAGITPKNRHRETGWGKPAGKEIW